MTLLQTLINTENDARNFGFEWPDAKMIVQQVMSECQEILTDLENQEPPEKLQEEIGDLLHAAISLCIFCNFDLKETLTKTNIKFAERLTAVKSLTQSYGLKNLKGQDLALLLKIWKEAKTFCAQAHAETQINS